MELIEILKLHLIKYPKMRPTDVVKLAYQNEFGPGHLLRNVSLAKEYFYNELSFSGKDKNLSLYEEIGGGLVRVNLAALSYYRVTPKRAFYAFVETAKVTRGTRQSFDEKLSALLSFDEYPFEKSELEKYINEYLSLFKKDEIPPPVSHSQCYRDAYNPHYRVVDLDKLNERGRIKNV